MENLKEVTDIKHIAIIMDGNRRWASEKKIDKKLGHKEGAKTLEKIVRYANKIGLEYITDYSKRADTENIRIKVLGDLTRLNNGLQKSINNAVERTKSNTGTTFCIALNYGGRDEIVNAVKKIAENIKKNNINIEDINEQLISDNLYTKGIPEPDLLIRTSGEMRLSNFLPWQLVYTEFLFIKKHWPDFNENDLDEAILEYNRRTRKFGAN